MKAVGVLAASITMFLGLCASPKGPETWTVIIGGQTAGYLSPCGCVKPMSGGIRRKFAQIKELRSKNTLVLETGNLVNGAGRQEVIKGETLAEALKASKVDALFFGSKDWALDPGVLAAFHRLSGEIAISTEPKLLADQELLQSLSKGPFLVGTAENASSFASQSATQKTVDDATQAGLNPVLLTNASEAEAAEIARTYKSLKLIVYQSEGNPSTKPIYIGDTILVSPGEKGKHLIKLDWNGVKFENYQVFDLGPDIKDDPKTAEIFARYQKRIRDEKLLDMVSRTSHTEFVGSESCRPCHGKEFEIWHGSDHAKAFDTLEKSGDFADPECVSCHVIGLDSIKGFQSKPRTPALAEVGCESCHGSGSAHIKDPSVKTPMSAQKSCVSCHNLEHSPEFDFDKYWPKIKH